MKKILVLLMAFGAISLQAGEVPSMPEAQETAVTPTAENVANADQTTAEAEREFFANLAKELVTGEETQAGTDLRKAEDLFADAVFHSSHEDYTQAITDAWKNLQASHPHTSYVKSIGRNSVESLVRRSDIPDYRDRIHLLKQLIGPVEYSTAGTLNDVFKQIFYVLGNPTRMPNQAELVYLLKKAMFIVTEFGIEPGRDYRRYIDVLSKF